MWFPVTDAAPAARVPFRNPLWRPVWGLYPDRRLLTSPALALLALLGGLLLLEWWRQRWLESLWSARSAVGAATRHLCALWTLWHDHGFGGALLLFGLVLLRRTVVSGLAPGLCQLPLLPAHLIAAVLLPLVALWAVREVWEWGQTISLAHAIAEPGERILWLVRRPGRITFLTDPGPPLPIVMSHNVVVGIIALLGYALWLLWWGWVLVAIAAARAPLGRSLLALACAAAFVALVGALLHQAQNWVPMIHPLSVWMVPPGTAAHAAWRGQLLTPPQHLALYLSMHLLLILVETGLIEGLRLAYARAQARFAEAIGGSPAH